MITLLVNESHYIQIQIMFNMFAKFPKDMCDRTKVISRQVNGPLPR